MPEFSFDLDMDALDTYEPAELPDWEEFDLSKPKRADKAVQMYRCILESRDNIRRKLDNGVNLEGKQKKIVKKDITDAVGRSENYLRESEFPNLHKFLSWTNDQLARKKPVGSKDKAKPKTKSLNAELEVRIQELTDRLDRLTHEPLIQSAVMGQMSTVRRQNIKLSEENEFLDEQVRELRNNIRSKDFEIEEQMRIAERYRQQIRDLGGKPYPAKTLRSVK